MRTEKIELRYQLRFHTAFHLGTGLRNGLIHRSIARDAKEFLYVPGSTLKGVLRDQATQIARLLEVEAREPNDPNEPLGEFAPRSDITALIFGSRFRQGTLFFDDARLCEEDRRFFRPTEGDKRFMPKQSEARTQVSISRVTGTARRGLLFSSEYGIPDMRFDSCIYGRLAGVSLIDDATKTYSLMLLLAALSSLNKIGGNKSAGAGSVTCTISELKVDSKPQEVQQYLDLLSEFELYELAEAEEN